MDDAELRSRIVEEFELPVDWEADRNFLEEAMDSLQVLELVAFIEELAGLGAGDVPEEYPALETLQDAIDYFNEIATEGWNR